MRALACFVFLSAFGLVAALWPAAVGAQCASVESPNSQYHGDQIHFQAGMGISGSEIQDAIAMWDSGCSGQMGNDFPGLLNGGSGGASYTVIHGGHNPDNAHCGVHVGNTITVFDSSTKSDGSRQSCGNTTQNLAHEIGHVLGLNDAPQTAQCQNHIMAWINRNNAFSRSVKPEECNKVDSKWRTSNEPSGGGGGQTTPPCV